MNNILRFIVISITIVIISAIFSKPIYVDAMETPKGEDFTWEYSYGQSIPSGKLSAVQRPDVHPEKNDACVTYNSIGLRTCVYADMLTNEPYWIKYRLQLFTYDAGTYYTYTSAQTYCDFTTDNGSPSFDISWESNHYSTNIITFDDRQAVNDYLLNGNIQIEHVVGKPAGGYEYDDDGNIIESEECSNSAMGYPKNVKLTNVYQGENDEKKQQTDDFYLTWDNDIEKAMWNPDIYCEIQRRYGVKAHEGFFDNFWDSVSDLTDAEFANMSEYTPSIYVKSTDCMQKTTQEEIMQTVLTPKYKRDLEQQIGYEIDEDYVKNGYIYQVRIRYRMMGSEGNPDEPSMLYGRWVIVTYAIDSTGQVTTEVKTDDDKPIKSEYDGKEPYNPSSPESDVDNNSNIPDSVKDDVEANKEKEENSIWDVIKSGLDNISSIFGKLPKVIRGIVSSIGAIPTLISKVFTYVPTEYLTLICMGLAIVVFLRILGR